MKVELTRDVSHLLTKGNRYTATRDIAGQVKIFIRSDMTIPAEFFREIDYRAADGTLLVEGTTYDLTVARRYGRQRGTVQSLHGWEFLHASEADYGIHRATATFLHRGSRFGGARRTIELADVLTATALAVQPAATE